MSSIISLVKENFALIFISLTLVSLIKFAVTSYLEHKKIKLMNKDSFEIMKSELGFTTVKIQTSDIKAEDLICGLNGQPRIKEERDVA